MNFNLPILSHISKLLSQENIQNSPKNSQPQENLQNSSSQENILNSRFSQVYTRRKMPSTDPKSIQKSNLDFKIEVSLEKVI